MDSSGFSQMLPLSESEDGVTLSLPTPLTFLLAVLHFSFVPCTVE